MEAGWSPTGAGPLVAGLAIGPLLRRADKVGRQVRVFDEMVSMLWDAGLVDAAIEVEAMWNELGGQYPFSVLCVYPTRPVS